MADFLCGIPLNERTLALGTLSQFSKMHLPLSIIQSLFHNRILYERIPAKNFGKNSSYVKRLRSSILQRGHTKDAAVVIQ